MGLITVAVVCQLYEAYILKTLLGEKGIRVFFGNEAIAQVYANAVGGIEIQVSSADAKKTRNWLAENGYVSCLTQ